MRPVRVKKITVHSLKMDSGIFIRVGIFEAVCLFLLQALRDFYRAGRGCRNIGPSQGRTVPFERKVPQLNYQARLQSEGCIYMYGPGLVSFETKEN